MRSGIVFQRHPLAPLIKGTAFGSWPTPQRQDARHSGDNALNRLTSGRQIQLAHAVELARFPTPTASMLTAQDQEQARTAGNGRLRKPYAESFPTPTKSDATGGALKDLSRTPKNRQGSLSLKEVTQGGPLNPTWVEWLMGWPTEWSALKPLATDKFRLWLRWHSAALRSLLGKG